MISIRYAVVLMAALSLAAPVSAQQRQRRVLTNEDVASSAPATPAPAPAAETAAPAEAAPAQAQPAEAEPAPEKPLAELDSKERLQRITEAQKALQSVMDEFTDRIQKEGDVALRSRLQGITMCLTSVMQETQKFVSELEQQVQQPQQQQAQQSAP